MIAVTGLDLSLRETGVARADGSFVIRYDMPAHATPLQRVIRLRDLGVLIDRACRGSDVVVMEGAFNGPHQSWELGELHGVVKVTLYQRGIPFVPIAPAKLKKYATNNGSAGKDKMLAAAIRAGFEGDNHNSADAFWLRHLGLGYYLNVSQGIRVAPTYCEAVIRSIRWPEIRRRGEGE